MIYVAMTFFMTVFAGIANGYNDRNVKREQNGLVLQVTKKKLIFQFFMFLSFLFPFLVAGLRHDVGTDYMEYLQKYVPNVMNGRYSYVDVEPLFGFMIQLSAYLGSYQWLFVFIHFLIMFFLYKHIEKMSPNVMLSVLLIVATGFFSSSLNVMRQSISIAIFLYAIQFIVDRKMLRYGIIITVASLFHTSALIFFPLYFLGLEKFEFKKKLTYTMGLLVLRLFLDPIKTVVINISQKLNFYYSYFGSVYDNSGNNYMYLLMNLSICLFAIYIEKKYKITDKNQRKLFDLFFSIQFIALVISVLAPIIPNCNRVIMMFSAVQITYIPLLLSKVTNGKIRILYVTLIISIYFLIFIKMYYLGNAGVTFPYKSIFSM